MTTLHIELIGSKVDIEDIRPGLISSVWDIIEENGKYFLSNKHLNSLNERHEMVETAMELIDQLNGAANIIYPDHIKVKLGSQKIINETGVHHVLITEPGKFQIRARGNLTHSGQTIVIPEIQKWMELSKTDQSVRDVLHFFNEITWWNLYKIYELIKDDMGGKDSLYTLIPKSRLSLFTQAAQSRQLLGDKARHASNKFIPPKIPLSLQEANNIIVNLYKKWIEIKMIL